MHCRMISYELLHMDDVPLTIITGTHVDFVYLKQISKQLPGDW